MQSLAPVGFALLLALLGVAAGVAPSAAAGLCRADTLGSVVCRPQGVGRGAPPILPAGTALDPETVPHRRLFLPAPALDRLGNRFVPTRELAPPVPALEPDGSGTRRCRLDRLGNLFCP